MSLVKRIGYGCTLGCDPTGGTSYAVLGAIVDGWKGPEAKADEADTSILVDKWKNSQPAQVDPGSMTFQIAYSPEDTGTTTVLTGLLTSGVVAGWEVTLPAVSPGTAQTKTFSGYVSGFSPDVKKANLVVADVTVRVSGNPGF